MMIKHGKSDALLYEKWGISIDSTRLIHQVRLSTDCSNASSVDMFKNTIDNYLRRADYT